MWLQGCFVGTGYKGRGWRVGSRGWEKCERWEGENTEDRRNVEKMNIEHSTSNPPMAEIKEILNAEERVGHRPTLPSFVSPLQGLKI